MLSLYVHIPFCVRKCLYCGFYSTQYSSRSAEEFVAAFEHDAVSYRSDFTHRLFTSIYIGGGTPTVLSSGQLERIVNSIRKCFPIADDVEFTVEANPNTVTNEKLVLLLKLGVTRLSLGVQSFSDDMLRTLGRLHSSGQAFDAFRLARIAGFRNIGIDLIFGIPGQTTAHWTATLDTVIALKPEHVSAYSLSLDKGSQWQREAEAGNFTLPEEEIAAAMYEKAVQMLLRAGYGHYEISNYAFPGFECRHNMNYWERGEYLGLGPGSWSFILGKRYSTVADTEEYSRRVSKGRAAVDVHEIVGPEQSATETVLLRLRTMKGLDLRRFEREFGPAQVRRLERNAVPLREGGLLHMAEGYLRLTDRGFLLSDEALARLSL